MNEFVTWEALGSYAGAVMMVTLITQFLKGTPLGHWNSQLVAYLMAAALLVGAESANGRPLTVQSTVLCLLNAVMVALAAGGAYDAAAMIAYLQKHAGNLTMLDGDAACRKIGSPKVLNMVMLGAVLRSGVLPLTLEEVTETMERTVKPQFRELNRKALHIEE